MQPFNRVPSIARKEPALMLSGASNLRFIPRKEGVPSCRDARRVLLIEGRGPHDTKNDLIPIYTNLEGKPGPARHSARAKAADEWATSPTAAFANTKDAKD